MWELEFRVMASAFDESDFIDSDYQSSKRPYTASTAASGPVGQRPPSREELELKVTEAQQKLAELKRAQDELERERAQLEEARRRRTEFQTGREEMLQHLVRGVGLLEEAVFAARRDAEQMGRTLEGLRDALEKVQGLQEERWTQENWNVELTRALTTIEQARLEWNAARLKWGLLNGESTAAVESGKGQGLVGRLWEEGKFWELSKLGLAFTWPLVVVGVLGLTVGLILLLRN